MCMRLTLALFAIGTLRNADATSCGFPGTPAHGSVHSNKYSSGVKIKSIFRPNDTVSYSCVEPCLMIGTGIRHCRSDGHWTGRVPICDCPLTDVKSTQSSTFDSQMAHYSAQVAIDQNTRTCSSTKAQYDPWWKGTWSNGTNVELVRIKSYDNEFENMNVMIREGKWMITCSIFLKGSFWSYQCPKNVKTTELSILIKSNGRKMHLSLCEVFIYVVKDSYECGKPELPINATYNKIGHRYYYSCKYGYELSHRDPLLCLRNGSWSSTAPLCQVPRCYGHGSIKHGNISHETHFNNSYAKSGTLLEITCYYGYELRNDAKIFCGNDSRWNGTAQCIAVSCGSPPNVKNGILIHKAINYTSIAVVQCNRGYEVAGNVSYVTCQGDKKWSTPTPTCRTGNIGTADVIDVYFILGIGLVAFLLLVLILIIIRCWCRGIKKNCVNIFKKKVEENDPRSESNNVLVINEQYDMVSHLKNSIQIDEYPESYTSDHIYTELEDLSLQESVYAEPELPQTHYAVTSIDSIGKRETDKPRILTSSYQIANLGSRNGPRPAGNDQFSEYKQSMQRPSVKSNTTLDSVGTSTYVLEENPIYE